MKKILVTLVFTLFICSVSLAQKTTGLSNIAYSPNGKLLATANTRGDVAFWDLQTLKEVGLFNSRSTNIRSLSFLPDNKKLLVTDDSQNTLTLVDVATGTEIKKLKLEGILNLQDVFFSADEQWMWVIFSPTYDKASEAWLVDLRNDSFTPRRIRELNTWINHPTRNLIAAFSTTDNKISLISAKDGQELRSFAPEKDFISESKSSYTPKIQMEFSHDGSRIFLYRKFEAPKKDPNDYPVKYLHEIASYAVETGKLLKKESFPVNAEDDLTFQELPSITVSPDNSKIFLSETSNGRDDQTRLITAIDANTLQRISEKKFKPENIDWDDLTPDGKYFLTADKTEKIKVYSVETQQPAGELFDSKDGFTKLVISPDDSKIAGVTAHGLIKIWSADGKELRKIPTELPVVKFIAFSPDGQNLISVHDTSILKGEDEKTLTKFKLWNLATGKLVREFDNYFTLDCSPTSFILLTKQGNRLISDCGSKEETIDFGIWNLQTGEFIGRQFPLPSNAYHLFWLSDQKTLNLTIDSRPAKTQINRDAEFYFWDFVDEKSIIQTKEQSEFRDAFPKNEDGYLIIAGTDSYTDSQMALVKIKGTDGLKIAAESFIGYYVSPGQTLGASFIAKPETQTESTGPISLSQTTTVIANPNKAESGSLIIYPAEKEKVKNLIELRDFDDADISKVLEGHTDEVADFVFMNNSKRGISAGYDRTVRVWDLETGKELFQLK